MISDTADPPSVKIEPSEGAPVRSLKPEELKSLGTKLTGLFDQYASDRNNLELKWLRNLRQYLGVYDTDFESQLRSGRSRAYPRITRVKCISVLSRIMNLMFPGNEKNWTLKASPSADMKQEDVQTAVERVQKASQVDGQQPPEMDETMVLMAVQELADERAKGLSLYIDDQLQELGGDQTLDYVSLNRMVLKSGIQYGAGLLQGPFVRQQDMVNWTMGASGPEAQTRTSFKPQYEFLPIWDFYPDLSAKTFSQMDGYFIRKVMSRSQLRSLSKRTDFYEKVIRSYLKQNTTGNYKAKNFETQLRTLGVRENAVEQKTDSGKYEVLIWNGPISGSYLSAAGVEVDQDKFSDEFNAEVWMVDGQVIKCDINAWTKLGIDVRTIHPFIFDDDDTSPMGNGLPNVMRDSQLAICAATRMLLDNASVVCGPNVEINMDLLRADQDLTSIEAYKLWYREGMGVDAQFPAVREIKFDSHMPELRSIVELFMNFADTETFVGPHTGGDMSKGPSEPMRSAAGASMLRSDAALPFKDIVRNFDSFTMSVIYSIVQFNKKFNPDSAPEGDYNVIARGATSLVAKEIRGMQLDQIAQTLTDGEKFHVDERKMAEARFAVRDLEDMLVSPTEAESKQRAASQQAQQMHDLQIKNLEAQIRELLSISFKNITQAQKNSAASDATTAKTALDLMERGLQDAAAGTLENKSGGAGQATEVKQFQ